MAFPLASSLLLRFKLPFPHMQNQFRKCLSTCSCLIPTKTILHKKCCFQSSNKSHNLLKCYSQRQSSSSSKQKTEEGEVDKINVYDLERLFSNLNQVSFKREPGSLSSAILLVAGTTVGAGILAIPAVTEESGFLASAVVCIVCWIYMVVTGLLIAEVNVKTMCELGSGGVSLVSMVRRTLGNAGVQVACWSYIFIHYALLVAYVARSSDILTNFSGIPLC